MDKRKFERKRKRFLLHMNGKPAVLLDISKTGIKLSAAFIPPSRKVDITINYGDKVFNLQGNIRWVRRKLTFQGPKDIGIRLENATEEFCTFVDSL